MLRIWTVVGFSIVAVDELFLSWKPWKKRQNRSPK
jgi:hypothetical protein